MQFLQEDQNKTLKTKTFFGTKEKISYAKLCSKEIEWLITIINPLTNNSSRWTARQRVGGPGAKCFRLVVALGTYVFMKKKIESFYVQNIFIFQHFFRFSTMDAKTSSLTSEMSEMALDMEPRPKKIRRRNAIKPLDHAHLPLLHNTRESSVCKLREYACTSLSIS